MSFHNDTVTYVTGAIDSLEGILTKTKDAGHDFPKLLESRIAPDMLPLSFQVWHMCNLTVQLTTRFMETEPVALGDYTDIKTFEDCQNVIAKARDVLSTIDKATFDARTSAIVEWSMGPRTGKFHARGYAVGYALPNIFFHLVTAYNILRKEGVNLGKRDYGSYWGIAGAEVR